MIIPVALVTLVAWTAECAVLDPALYLAPSPPLTPTSNSISPGELWTGGLEAQVDRSGRDINEGVKEINESPAQKTEAAVGRMFWPRFSSPQPALGIHIPLTFSLSGTYGKVPAAATGVVGNAYTGTSNLGSSLFGKTTVANVYGRSALAGSSYGAYGTAVRIYGGDNSASWSGWGNGKWGHYGKG